jgi:hypothetical protein
MDGITLVWVAIALLYMLPWIVAKSRSHANSLAIFWLNAFVGWSVVGWVACLIWALLKQEATSET